MATVSSSLGQPTTGVPDFRDFNTNQFSTTGRKVAIKSGVNITNLNSFGSITNASFRGSFDLFSGLNVQTDGSGDVQFVYPLTGNAAITFKQATESVQIDGTYLDVAAGGLHVGGSITGALVIEDFNGGVNADNAHFWRGDGTWAIPPGSGGGSATNITPWQTNIDANSFSLSNAAVVQAVSFSGSGSNLTDITVASVASTNITGLISAAQLTNSGTSVGTFNAVTVDSKGRVTAGSDDVSAATNANATTLFSSGTLPLARLPGTVVTNNATTANGLPMIGQGGSGAATTNVSAFATLINVLDATNSARWNVKAFGAVGNGKTATVYTTNGNVNVTVSSGSFVAGDVGKVISIYEASTNSQNLTTTIAGVADATHISLATAPLATVAATLAVYGTDDTVPIQAGINFISTNGGGTLFFPANTNGVGAIYIVNGALQDTGTNTLHHNAQLYFPNINATASASVTPIFTFEGAAAAWPGDANGGSTYGATIWSTYPRGPTNEQGRVLDVQNFVDPMFQVPCGTNLVTFLNRIGVRVKNMRWVAARDANLAVLDLSGANTCKIEDVMIDTGYKTGGSDPSTYNGQNGFGFATCGHFNNNINVQRDVTVRGFYHGMKSFENGIFDGGLIADCYHAVWVVGGSPRYFLRMNVQETRNIFKASGCETVIFATISSYNFIFFDAGNAYLTSDPVGYLSGEITYMHNGTVPGILPTEFPLNIASSLAVRHFTTHINPVDPLPPMYDTALIASNHLFVSPYVDLFGATETGIGWGTNMWRFANSPQWKMYHHNGIRQFALEHSETGKNQLLFSDDDTGTIGVLNKNLTFPGFIVEPAVAQAGTTNILLIDTDGTHRKGVIGSGLSLSGFTLSATGGGGGTTYSNLTESGFNDSFRGHLTIRSNVFAGSVVATGQVIGVAIDNSILTNLDSARLRFQTKSNGHFWQWEKYVDGAGASGSQLAGVSWDGSNQAERFYFSLDGSFVDHTNITTEGSFIQTNLGTASTTNLVLANADGTLRKGTIGSGLSLAADGTLSSTGGGGITPTFNPNQFDNAGGTTNIPAGAPFTNVDAFVSGISSYALKTENSGIEFGGTSTGGPVNQRTFIAGYSNAPILFYVSGGEVMRLLSTALQINQQLSVNGTGSNDFRGSVGIAKDASVGGNLNVVSNGAFGDLSGNRLVISNGIPLSLLNTNAFGVGQFVAFDGVQLTNSSDGHALTNLPGVINVRDFGATGNGSSDDTAAFVAANAAAGGTNIVYVPIGSYSISPLTLTSSMRGEGQFSKLLYRQLTNSVAFIDLSIPQLSIQKISLVGSNANFKVATPPLSNVSAIRHNSTGIGRVEEVAIIGFTTGLEIIGTNAPNSRVQNSFYANNAITNCFTGIYLSPSNQAEYILIGHNSVMGCTKGIENDSAANGNFVANKVLDNTTNLVIAPSTTDANPARAHSLYVGNIFNHPGPNAPTNVFLAIFNGNNASFVGNHFLGGGSLLLTACSNLQFQSCFFQLSGAGLLMSGGSTNIFANNTLSDTSISTRTGNTISNSLFFNNYQPAVGWPWENTIGSLSVVSNIGIGIVSPTVPLHVKGVGNVDAFIESTGASGYAELVAVNNTGAAQSYGVVGSSYGGSGALSPGSGFALSTATNGFNVVSTVNMGIGLFAGGSTSSNLMLRISGNGVINSSGQIRADSFYATNDISALTFTDRSKSPNDLKDAYEIVASHKTKNGHVDHTALSPKAWGTKTRVVTNTAPRFVKGKRIQDTKLGVVVEPDKDGRDLGMVISAQALVIQDLQRRLEALEKKQK